MLGVILTGHGQFASGFYQAACQIVGKLPQFVAVDFHDGKSSDELEEELRKAVISCDLGQGVIFMTDILGGFPFRCASLISMEKESIEVITGTNMQMLLEILLERDELSLAKLTLTEFRERVISSGVSGITTFWHQSQEKRFQEVGNDGI